MSPIRIAFCCAAAWIVSVGSVAAICMMGHHNDPARVFHLDDSIVICIEGKVEDCLVVDMHGNPRAGETIETVSESGSVLAKTDAQGRTKAMSYSHGAYLHIDGQRIPLYEFALAIVVKKSSP